MEINEIQLKVSLNIETLIKLSLAFGKREDDYPSFNIFLEDVLLDGVRSMNMEGIWNIN